MKTTVPGIHRWAGALASGLSLLAVPSGMLVAGGCERRSSGTTERVGERAGQQGASAQNKEGSTVSASGAINQARALGVQIGAIYQQQNQQGPISVEAATRHLHHVCSSLLKELPADEQMRFSVSPEARDFSRPEARTALAKSLLDSFGILINPGVKHTADPNRVFFTCEMVLVKGEAQTFTAPRFKVGSIQLPDVQAVAIREVREQFSAHYENIPGNRITGEAFVMPGQYSPSGDIVVLSPSALVLYAERTGKDIAVVRESVILNELAHASIERFFKDIPNPEQLQFDLSVPGGKAITVDMHQLHEAFSDYVSIRYGKDLVGFLAERGGAPVTDYALSRYLLRNGLASVLRASPAIVPAADLNRPTFEASAVATAEYLRRNPSLEAAVQQRIADVYEYALEKIMKAVLESSPPPSGGR